MGKEDQLHVPEGNRDAPAMRSNDFEAEPTGLVPPPYHKSEKDAEKNPLGKEATVDVASERSLTFGTMMKGSAASKLTVFERKAALINARVASRPASRVLTCTARLTRWAWVDTRFASGFCADLVISWIWPGRRV